jgi:hypothetical protein
MIFIFTIVHLLLQYYNIIIIPGGEMKVFSPYFIINKIPEEIYLMPGTEKTGMKNQIINCYNS